MKKPWERQFSRLLNPVVVRQQLGVTLLYGNNDINQIGGEGVRATIAYLPRASTRAPAPLIIRANLIPPLIRRLSAEFRIALQQQSAQTLQEKVGSVFMVNVRLIKNRNRSVVYNPNTERAYFENVQDAVLSGITKSALKDHWNT